MDPELIADARAANRRAIVMLFVWLLAGIAGVQNVWPFLGIEASPYRWAGLSWLLFFAGWAWLLDDLRDRLGCAAFSIVFCAIAFGLAEWVDWFG